MKKPDKKLAVGDRVRVRIGSSITSARLGDGKIEKERDAINGQRIFEVRLDADSESVEACRYVAWESQCRRLKPKPRPDWLVHGVNAPRLVMYAWQDGSLKWVFSKEKPVGCALFHRVVGCSEYEKPLSRSDIAKAWNAQLAGGSNLIAQASKSTTFKIFCKALGLEGSHE